MARIKLRYLIEKPGAAGPRYFWQPSRPLRALGWRPERLPDDRAAAIAEAERLNAQLDAWRRGDEGLAGARGSAKTAPRPGTMEALIRLYCRDEAFTRLKPSTRRGYLQCLDLIAAEMGEAPVRSVSAKVVKAWYRALKTSVATVGGKRVARATPAKAAAAIRVLRLLLEFARREKLIQINPASQPGLRDTAVKGRLWSHEAVAAFVAAADDAGWHSLGTAVMLDEWLGQREGDLLALRRDAYRDGALHMTQAKTGAGVVLPIGLVQPLVQRLEGELARQRTAKVTAVTLLVCESTRAAWRPDHFRHAFAAVRDSAAAALPELTGLWFMHLRHTAVTRLAEANCELPLIAAVTGHSLKTVETIVDRYLVRTAAMARQAFKLRLEMEGGQ
jgi:hypothetical protein